jgi:hypothetical protein
LSTSPLARAEKRKKGQDLYIDSLEHQIKANREQLELYEAQLEVQRRETQEADVVLRCALGRVASIHGWQSMGGRVA